MAFAIRFLVYVAGGGALLAWLQPSRGLLEIVAVCAWIGVCVALDALFTNVSAGNKRPAQVGGRARRSRRAAEAKSHQDDRDTTKRRGLRTLFTSANLAEAEHLAALLRERGLHPMAISQTATEAGGGVTVEIRLPESEFRRALPIVNRFSAQRAKS
jgi:hypothetical protein